MLNVEDSGIRKLYCYFSDYVLWSHVDFSFFRIILRKERKMTTFLLLIQALIIPLLMAVRPEVSLAADYEIVKVIEVGPCDGGPMSWPLKWSPDGTKLAYFYNNSLYISDTLGHSTEVTHFDLYPYSYEWLSDYEVIIHIMNNPVPQPHKLVKVDVKTGQVTVLEEFTRRLGIRYENDPKSFDGPSLTAEGRVYYRTNVIRANVFDSAKQSEPEPIVFPESAYPRKTDSLPPDKNHFLSWGKDGLYMIRCDLTDSVKIASEAKHPIQLPPAINTDESLCMIRCKICSLDDAIYVAVDTFLTRHKGVIGYSCLYYSFNPHDNEVLFQLGCEKNENLEKGLPYDETKSYEEFNIATFNYAINRLTILDPLIGHKNCQAPTYAPDGLKIAFLSGGSAYIMYRRAKI
jgi:hypothetical protein